MIDPRHEQLVLGTKLSSASGKQPIVALRGVEASTHLRVIGTSGSGKSRFLTTIVPQKMRQGRGVALIDPHGDSAYLLLGYLLDSGFYRDPRALDRLLYVDLSRKDRFLPFNVLDSPLSPREVASIVLEGWKRAWPAISGGHAPNLEQTLLASVFLLTVNKQPLTMLSRLLGSSEADADYRSQLLSHATSVCKGEDADALRFFTDRFDRRGRWAPDLNESVLRRVFLLTWSDSLRYSLGQHTNRLPFRALMDRGVSVLVNLGGLPPDASRFLGALLCVGFEQAALSRVDVADARERRPFTLIIDEYSRFAAGSDEAMQNILAQARKYGLQLVLAQQSLSQSGWELEGALQNARQVVFRLGREDAVAIAPRLHRYNRSRVYEKPVDPLEPEITSPAFMSETEQLHELQQQLMTLPRQEAVVLLGQKTVRFKALGMPEPQATREQIAQLQEEYARRLLVPREQISVDSLNSGDEVPAQQTPEAPPVVPRPGRGPLRRRVELLPFPRRTEE